MLSGDHKFRWTKALPAFNKLSDPENHQLHGRYKHMPGKQSRRNIMTRVANIYPPL